MSTRKFRCVSEETIAGLQTYGNWKVRQNAIESLAAAIQELHLGHDVMTELPAFIDFLFELLDDPNFKIKQGCLETIRALIRKLGPMNDSYLSSFICKLAERLTDPKAYVKEGCISAFGEIMENIGPTKVLLALKHTKTSETVTLKEEIILLHLMALMRCKAQKGAELDHFFVTLTMDAFKEAVMEESGMVAGYAIEGLCFLKENLSSNEFHALLHDGEKLSKDTLQRLEICLEKKKLNAVLNDQGFIEIKIQDIDHFHSADSQEDFSKNENMKELGNQFHRKLLLQSHPVQLKQHLASQEENHTNPQKISPLSGSRYTAVPHTGANLTSEEIAFNSEKISVEGNVSQRVQAPIELAPKSMTSESSGNIAARIDRIAKLLRRKDESTLPTNLIQTSKSAVMSVKRRENLTLLKMKQRDRRTHSANAVLQRKDPLLYTKSKYSTAPEPQTLPSLYPSSPSRHVSNSRHPSEDSEQQSAQTTSIASPGAGEISTFIKARQFAHRRFSRKRKEAHCTSSEAFPSNKTTPISSISLVSEEDGGYESPGAISIPASTTCTRPGTYASGISPKTMIADIATTEPFIDADAVAESVLERLRVANNARKKEMDWLSQAEALNDARRLVYHHPQVVRRVIRDLVLAFVPALQQLRSTTARTAITLCQDLFEHLGESIDHDLDEITPLLLKKAGETSNAGRNTFLAAEADKALNIMVRTVTTSRVLHTLLQNANHSSKFIRSKVAAHLDDCLVLAASKLKPASHLNLIDRIFQTAVAFLEEGYQQTRLHGKRILWHVKQWINNRGALERLIGQLEPESKKRRVLEITQSSDGPPSLLPLRGIPSRALERHSNGSMTPLTPSLIALTRAPRLEGSADSALSNSAVFDQEQEEFGPSLELQVPQESYQMQKQSQGWKKRRPPKPLDQSIKRVSSNGAFSSMESAVSISEAVDKLNAKDWRERIDALEQLNQMANKLTNLKEKDLTNMIDQLTYRLNDGNSKVVITTLETLKSVLGRIGSKSIPSINTVLPALASNLASSIEKIRSSADDVINHIIQTTDGAHLVQTFSYCCAHANPRTKALLLQKLRHLASHLYSSRPQLIAKYILPIAFNALGDVRVDVREANGALLRDLSQLVEHPFIKKAETLIGTNRQRLFDILHASY